MKFELKMTATDCCVNSQLCIFDLSELWDGWKIVAWCKQQFNVTIKTHPLKQRHWGEFICLKGTVHPKMKILCRFKTT